MVLISISTIKISEESREYKINNKLLNYHIKNFLINESNISLNWEYKNNTQKNYNYSKDNLRKIFNT